MTLWEEHGREREKANEAQLHVLAMYNGAKDLCDGILPCLWTTFYDNKQ